MIYVQRDATGKIVAVYAAFQAGYAEEQSDLESPEVVEFFNQLAQQSS